MSILGVMLAIAFATLMGVLFFGAYLFLKDPIEEVKH
jgi:hypothetical protein